MTQYDGVDERELAARLSLPRVVVLEVASSTQDAAHGLAANGADSGTLVIADTQSAGRGRLGHTWTSEAGAGVWLTLIERPASLAALEVLSLRVGIALAPVLDSLAGDFVALKWPNDLYVGERKLGGVLIEIRWRGTVPDWVAIGVGINVRAPAGEPRATGLPDGVSRLDVLDLIVGKLRIAASRFGSLSPGELATFATRDLAAGRTCSEPVRGLVLGIDDSGALLVDVGSTVAVVRAGSLVLEAGPDV